MAPSHLQFRFERSLQHGDPDALITLNPSKVSAMHINLNIRAEHHVVENDVSFPTTAFSINLLVERLEHTVMKIITSKIQDQINSHNRNRNTVIKQLVMDAWTRSGRGNITEQITDIMQELRECLPSNLTEVRSVSDLFPMGWAPTAIPHDVAQILFAGILKCANDQRGKIEVNLVFFKWLVRRKALALSKNLIQVSCYQHGGIESFRVYLTANNHVVEFYMTQEVEAMVRMAQVELDVEVQRHCDRLIEIAMHQGDWRIWPCLD